MRRSYRFVPFTELPGRRFVSINSWEVLSHALKGPIKGAALSVSRGRDGLHFYFGPPSLCMGQTRARND